MSDLKKRAEKLGLEIDGRWSDETLQQKVEEAEAAKAQSDQAKQATNDRADKRAQKIADADVQPVSQGDLAAASTDTLPTLGGPRVASAQEVREEQAGETMEPAPYPGDPVEAHDMAARLSQQTGYVPEFDTSDIQKGEKGEDLYPIRLLNDWWDGQGIRHKRGETIEVPYNEALRLVGERKAERADAFTAARG